MPEPRGMHDMTGWHALPDCATADVIHERHRDMPGWRVVSGLTDMDGDYGTPQVFREWWQGDQPILRDYRWPHSDRPCEHYGALDDTAASHG